MPLQLTVQNNLAATKVFLDSKYEGLFNVQTKLDKVTVKQSNATDPVGNGRRRTVRFDQNSSDRVRGWVGWGKRPVNSNAVSQGQVKITASLCHALLHLGS